MIKIDELMSALSQQAPVLDKEADFERQFAGLLRENDPGCTVKTQFPHRLDGPINIDMVFEKESQKIAIELKYFTRALSIGTVNLKEQGANDLFRHDVMKDLQRIERLVESGEFKRAILIVLTNEKNIWRQSTRVNSFKEFEFYDGRTISGSMNWGPTAGPGTRQNREKEISVTGEYICCWQPYSNIEDQKNGEFRYLVFDVA